MRLNEHTAITAPGFSFVLVPYLASHVPRYHEWMKSPELQEATASEPLTLKEEYDMQRSWHLDEDKLTFIIQEIPSHTDRGSAALLQGRMLGDVNLFLSQDGELGGIRAEAEIMIAEPDARRSGIAFNTLRLLFLYAMAHLPLKTESFFCKIGAKNERSKALFEKLGFREIAFSEVWQEREMQAEPEAQRDVWSKDMDLQEMRVSREPLSLE